MSAKPTPKPVVSRPLSPFMLGQYYRFQISSFLSITHRVTGCALAVGSILLAVWVMSAAMGPLEFQQFNVYAHTPIGLFLLLGWSWALLYHLCNGIRHFVWDAGYAFEKKHVDLGGWIVVAASALLTAAVWACAYLIPA